ncbi:MAG: hypothetical protein NT013_24650 [Planctomycetia bacterium]|nr:hypothetical protein [Planctomycetia bacterium]
MPNKLPITDLLRNKINDSINDSKKSFLTLEQETGVLRQSLMKFARGDSTIHLDAADKLASYFGLELGPVATPKRKAGK